jgi:serine phosphatase RsbU (regulator of sigma subunit)
MLMEQVTETQPVNPPRPRADMVWVRPLSSWSAQELVSRSIFGMLILIVLLICTICGGLAVRWIDKPFAGFLVSPRMVLGNMGSYHWTGTQAGLKFPDKVLTANGQPIASISDLERVISPLPVGTPITYTVERGGQIIEVVIPTMRFTQVDLATTFGIPFVSGIFYFLIGVIVFLLKPDTHVTWAFLLSCFFLSLYTIIAFDIQSTHWGFAWLYFLTGAFFPAAFLQLSLIFPQPKKSIERYPRLQLLPYLVATMLLIPLEVLYPRPAFMLFQQLVRLSAILSALAMMASSLQAYMAGSSVLARQRAKVVLFGTALAFPLPALAFYVSLFGGTSTAVTIQNNFLAIPIVIFPASIAYAIVRHNLFDVDVYIKRAVGYALMTILVAMAYVSTQAMARTLLFPLIMADYTEQGVPILFALLIVFLFNPMNRRIQDAVDKIFFRKQFDYKQTVLSVTSTLNSVLDVDVIAQQILWTVKNEMFLDTVGLVLLEPQRNEHRLFFIRDTPQNGKGQAGDIHILQNDPLLALLSREKRMITAYDVIEDPRYMEVKIPCMQSFTNLDASMVLPLLYQGEISGVITLGQKKSGHFYTREDIDLLTTLANQGAVAIENAKLFQEHLEKTRLDEELKIARNIQMSMLPTKAPAIAGFEIAARSLPARQVGGDFYDFLEVQNNGVDKQLGIVVGDVSGKAMSAALLMAASRSVLRVLSESHASVAEVMSRGNQRLKKDIKKGMFVALLYVVVDPVRKTLTLSSAGQTQPILCRGDGSSPTYIETPGDKFPLGIVANCHYQETCISLQHCDTIVLYTDGVVEAMNGQREMYGFERLLVAIERGRDCAAASLLESLIDDVSHFVGHAEQHDDLTVVVLKAD